MLFYSEKHITGDTGLLTVRTRERVSAMLNLLEVEARGLERWLGAEGPSLLDCYLCPMLRWIALYPEGEAAWFDLARWPRLLAVAERMDARPETVQVIAAEGLGPTPFSAPTLPDPPEGSPT